MRIRKNADRHVPAQEQEPPNRTRRAVLTGGAVGLAAVAGGATLTLPQPAEAQTSTDITQIMPSADQTGTQDTKNIMAAINALTTGGTVYLGPGIFYITYVPGTSPDSDIAITVPAQTGSETTTGGMGVSIQGCGSATVVYVLGSYTGFFVHRGYGYGAQYGLLAQGTTVFLRDFVVNGCLPNGSPSANAIGVDIGDGWGYDMNLVIVNFSGSGAVGLNIINRIFWTEKGRFRAQLMNNTTAAVLGTLGGGDGGGDESHEYNFYDFNIFCNTGQQGVVINQGLYNNGCTLWLHGNMAATSAGSGDPPTNNVAALTLTDASTKLYVSEIIMKVEGNGPTGAVLPYGIYCAVSSNQIEQCHGIISHTLSPSDLNGAEFSFRGVCDDPGLALLYPGAPGTPGTNTSPPTVPASGIKQRNYGPDAMVYVTGGTVSDVTVNTISTNQNSGGFYVPAGGMITLTYSVAPSWTWVPAGYSIIESS